MQKQGVEGYITFGFDNFSGLIPRKRFIKLGEANGLPDESHNGVIEGLLEPEPKSWLENKKFPHLWRYLMHDICRNEKIILLHFELNPNDQAYVVERAHIERRLYHKNPSRELINTSFKKYWESRISVFEYKNNYCLPQLAIWSGIEFERLEIEWEKSSDEVWKRVLDKNW